MGFPMAGGVADAMQGGLPSASMPGGNNDQAWQIVSDGFNKVDAGLRGLRSMVLHAMPACSRQANQLDKLAYELGRIQNDLQQKQAEYASEQMQSQTVQQLGQI